MRGFKNFKGSDVRCPSIHFLFYGSVLGPRLFNIHINDLFHNTSLGTLHAYADDEQLYHSDSDPTVLESKLEHDLGFVNTWYSNNSMIVNHEKYQAMGLV